MSTNDEISKIANKWDKGERVDQDTLIKLAQKKLNELQMEEEERKKAKYRKFSNALKVTFNLLTLALAIAGFIYLNVMTAKDYVGLSTVEIFWKKSFTTVCNYTRCIKPGTHKKRYYVHGMRFGKGSACYYCDEHIKVAPKTLSSFTPVLAKIMFFISLVGLGGLYFVILVKTFRAAIERDEFFGYLTALILVSAGVYLIPTAVTFAM